MTRSSAFSCRTFLTLGNFPIAIFNFECAQLRYRSRAAGQQSLFACH